ncbi:transposase [Streptomyces decoyicus]|uniref:transposase n=1 Tax=Streptomyces decoyicus TaxID=249567 RepID=UPI00366330A3
MVLLCCSGWFLIGLWDLVAPLPLSFNCRPRDGGTAPRDERSAVVGVLVSGGAWQHLSETFGSPAMVHVRFCVWCERADSGLFAFLGRAVALTCNMTLTQLAV